MFIYTLIFMYVHSRVLVHARVVGAMSPVSHTSPISRAVPARYFAGLSGQGKASLAGVNGPSEGWAFYREHLTRYDRGRE
jgi:hypothetical protein